jgi:hypothetical protein
MIYDDQITDAATKADYYAVRERVTKLLHDGNAMVISALEAVQKSANHLARNDRAAAMLLARHAIEMSDGIGVLVSKGCAEPCKVLLRSLLEATMGVAYIVEADSERRDLAYQVAHAHRRIKLYQKWDCNTPQGKTFAAEMAGDSMWQSIKPQSVDLPKAIANLEAMLKTPAFVPIEAEWQRYKVNHPKTKADPAWHSLFGGPANVRDMAKHLDMRGEYECLYRYWSDAVHAGNAMSQIKSFDQDGERRAMLMPLRFPEGIQMCVVLAVGFCLKVGFHLVSKYAHTEVDAYRKNYIDTVQAEYMGLVNAGRLFTWT